MADDVDVKYHRTEKRLVIASASERSEGDNHEDSSWVLIAGRRQQFANCILRLVSKLEPNC